MRQGCRAGVQGQGEGAWGWGRGAQKGRDIPLYHPSVVHPFFPMSLVYIILCMLYKINCIRMNQYNFILTSTISVVNCV